MQPDPARRQFGTEHDSVFKALAPLAGKTIIFVVDERDLKIESTLLSTCVFHSLEAGTKSRVVAYSEFLSSQMAADVLVLRASGLFEARGDEVGAALDAFRSANTKATVVVCSLANEAEPFISRRTASGVVDVVETRPEDDFLLLRKAMDARRREHTG